MQLFNCMKEVICRLVFCYCLLSNVPGAAQTVKNLRTNFDQSKQLMLIQYDLEGLTYKQEAVVVPSFTSGDTAHIAMKNLSGDYGVISRGGKNKLVVWDPLRDGLNGLKDVQVTLKTTVRDAVIPSYWGLELQGSNSAPFGVRLLQLSQLGFFGGIRVGSIAPSYDYIVSNDGKLNYVESGIYEIGNKRRLAGYAITGGLLWQLTRNAYAYLGGGWGAEQLFWEYQVYNLDYDLIDSDWALNENINRKGITVDVGAVFHVKRMLFDLGLSTIQFKSIQITAGLGFSFLNKQKPWIR